VHILDAQNSVSGLHELQEIALKRLLKRATAMPQAQSALRGWTGTDGVPAVERGGRFSIGLPDQFYTKRITMMVSGHAREWR